MKNDALRHLRLAVAGMITVSPLLSGCGDYWTSTVSRTTEIAPGSSMVTTADLRVINRSMRLDDYGISHVVTCSEPSPDVAKILSAGATGSLSASAEAAGEDVANADLVLMASLVRAEALAQLGQRLATIQLLRDGLFRACEAYANRAISATTYGMIVARYDDIMITMLLAEFAATAGRPSPVQTLTSMAAVTGRPEQKKPQAGAKQEEDQQEEGKQGGAKPEGPGEDLPDPPADKVEARTAAGHPSAANGEPQRPAGMGVPEAMVAMQRAYLDDPNIDALLTACLAELAATPGIARPSDLAEACRNFAGSNEFRGMLSQVGQDRILRMLIYGDPTAAELVARIAAARDLRNGQGGRP
ncbi:hypothetical protein AUP44_04315 [Tistrella mobilis]|uniref:Lipoprotein n=2 Tax=Tistrella mobilis TaxID=171437 RepID=A0A162L2K3_9PROT|nr:hypothetical protein [Tistrella mobilis]KYO52923.1 hypothetical protein AUP44_04315 [Tistrella mobilis]